MHTGDLTRFLVLYMFFFLFFCSFVFFFFFFKQKTAYEIYQCDWSSDVCSSDLTYLVGFVYNLADGSIIQFKMGRYL